MANEDMQQVAETGPALIAYKEPGKEAVTKWRVR